MRILIVKEERFYRIFKGLQVLNQNGIWVDQSIVGKYTGFLSYKKAFNFLKGLYNCELRYECGKYTMFEATEKTAEELLILEEAKKAKKIQDKIKRKEEKYAKKRKES